MTNRTFICALMPLAAAIALIAAASAVAQSYPAKPVRTVIGFTPGGTTDIVARILGQKLTELWGQTVVVEGRPGAAANLAAEHIAKSAPDGYSLLLAQNALAVSPALYAKMAYDVQRDLVAITSVALTPHVIVVHPSVPARTVKELVVLAKARPGEILMASSGHGNSDHMAGELLNTMTGVKMVHVPYKGGQLALTDTAGGHVAVYYPGLAASLQFIRTGRVRALAVTTKVRAKTVPDLPTVAEAGVPGYEAVLWFGYFAPAGASREVVTRLATDINRVLMMPDTLEKLAAAGTDPFPGSPEQFDAFMKSEITKWGAVVKRIGLKLDG